jgi:dTDP-4-amino-4,6-dideoxygalactose transaminase
MKIPSAGTPIGFKDLLRSFFNPPSFKSPRIPPHPPLEKGGRKDFKGVQRGIIGGMGGFSMEEALKKLIGVKHCFLVNSGTTAFYLILKTLIRHQESEIRNPKNEVILPAYTAPSLILPIKKLGLSYRLADISLETFNMDEEALIGSLSPETLAILPVHLFGLPSPIERLIALGKERGFYIIEDAASSFGTKDSNGSHSGTRGDIGFFSFNRGKNISTISGGAIITNDAGLAKELRKEVEALPDPDFFRRLRIYLEGIGLSLAVRPWFYTIFYPLVSKFKETTLHEDFESYRYTSFQGALGLSLIEKAETIFQERNNKGQYLYEALKGLPGIRLPRFPNNWRVVFNQFPIIVDDHLKRDELLKRIFKAGIEVTTLYDKPVHRIFRNDFSFTNDPFPNATYMARRLLLIPTHPFIEKKDLERVVEIIKVTLR